MTDETHLPDTSLTAALQARAAVSDPPVAEPAGEPGAPASAPPGIATAARTQAALKAAPRRERETGRGVAPANQETDFMKSP